MTPASPTRVSIDVDPRCAHCKAGIYSKHEPFCKSAWPHVTLDDCVEQSDKTMLIEATDEKPDVVALVRSFVCGCHVIRMVAGDDGYMNLLVPHSAVDEGVVKIIDDPGPYGLSYVGKVSATGHNLERAMIDVRNAVDAQGLKIRLVDVFDRKDIADKFKALSEALIVAMNDTFDSTVFKRNRVTLAAHVKLLARLQEAYWLYDNAYQGIF
jgi:hypothetical protein